MMEIDVIEQSLLELSPELISILLTDKTTSGYIRWGSDNYTAYGPAYAAEREIMPYLITKSMTTVIQPRVSKTEEERIKRTRDQAEVFTPSWVCNEQNNLIDAAWFDRPDVFNKAGEKSWVSTLEPVIFPESKTWQQYVDARRLEISCGEAPYLVSRYDTVTGQPIEIKDRIGFLDRKLRIVNENAANDEEWLKWTMRAFQSCYGYDLAGDNVLLARENLLYTFIEYAEARNGEKPSLSQLKKFAHIIAWNIWQMNGLTMTVPFSVAEPDYEQTSLFPLEDEESTEKPEIPCRIFDWRANESIEFRSLIKEG